MSAAMRIGVLTAGGDCPGLNAVIRAVARSAIEAGDEAVGIMRGFQGLAAHESLRLARAWSLAEPLWIGLGLAQLLHAFIQRRLTRELLFWGGTAVVLWWLLPSEILGRIDTLTIVVAPAVISLFERRSFRSSGNRCSALKPSSVTAVPTRSRAWSRTSPPS